MLSIKNQIILDEAVTKEWTRPRPRKIENQRDVYLSANFHIPDHPGVPIISDFGDAHFGEPPFFVEVMPDLYRAPEMVLGIAWDEKIDIWAFGLMVRIHYSSD